MSVREYVYNLLRTDNVLSSMGIPGDAVFPNFAPDAPLEGMSRFLVLRWGLESATVGRDTTVRGRTLAVWVYDVEPDFTAIDRAIKRIKALLLASEGQPHGSGWVNGIVDNGGSEDLPATEYGREAVARNWAFTINASEE